MQTLRINAKNDNIIKRFLYIKCGLEEVWYIRRREHARRRLK